MDVELLDAKAVSRCLKKLVEKHDEIHIAVAWGYNGPLADVLLNNAKKFASFTIGVAFCQTHPGLIDRMVGLRNAFVADTGGKTFHPKLYYFRSGDYAEAIIGSSNFTGGGLSRNWEACLHVKGHVDSPVFVQVRELLASYDSLRKPVTAAVAKIYRLQFDAAKKLRKPKNPVLPSDRNGWQQFTSSLVSMDWDTYVNAIRSSRHHALDQRLSLLRTCQRFFASVGSFADLSENEWKAIAGVIGEAQKRDSKLDGHDWGWFGSMRGMGDFANRIAEQDIWLSRAVDSIPRHGDIQQTQYDEFCTHFLQAFASSHRTGGVPTATRLLAMKRPDTFVCVSKPNKVGLAKAIAFSPSTLNLANYWERIVEPVRASAWYNAVRPSGPEAEIWDGRVAMLDAIYYAP